MTETHGHERRGADGGKNGEGRVSLHPLDFEEALRGLLRVEPPEAPTQTPNSRTDDMDPQPEQGDNEGQEAQIIMEPAQMAGVWANYARVGHSPYEFTLDFVRLDFSNTPPNGIVVARVSVSPLFISQLIDALNANWQQYAQRALPKAGV
ncbi:MAG TPA: DUF3467 domain-containing protein [Acidimicrobiales bacterium]|nr:DUF3467 domain-containing protein [Acidimicrobiales bacterium]